MTVEVRDSMIRVMMLKTKIASYHEFTKQERDLLLSFCELYGDGSSWLFQTACIIHDMPDFARHDTSNHPPAKPGAFASEPLKAAIGALRDPMI